MRRVRALVSASAALDAVSQPDTVSGSRRYDSLPFSIRTRIRTRCPDCRRMHGSRRMGKRLTKGSIGSQRARDTRPLDGSAAREQAAPRVQSPRASRRGDWDIYGTYGTSALDPGGVAEGSRGLSTAKRGDTPGNRTKIFPAPRRGARRHTGPAMSQNARNETAASCNASTAVSSMHHGR